MKIFFYLAKLSALIRGGILRCFLCLCGCHVGKGLKCKGWPWFRQIPNKNIVFGDYVTIGKRIVFDVSPTGLLQLGNHVNLTQDIVISSKQKVSLGNNTLVGEFVSIRDADHGIHKGMPIASQEHVVNPIVIGEDVWIAAGVRILRGACVADGVVVAANSVVTHKTEYPPAAVIGGIPAKLIKMRGNIE